MALKDKLDRLSQQIVAEKEIEQKAQENENLKPIRANIKKLQKEKLDLEIIKNSLDYKSQGPKDGLGMQEYAKKATDEKTKTRSQLEEIAKQNKAALEKLGVTNVDELADKEEFAEDEEVVDYKKALDQESGVQLSDTELQNRLANFGITIDEKIFSYTTASEEIGLRLKELEQELLSEKIKTPEGKEEAITQLVEEFSKNTKSLGFESSSIKRADKNNEQSFNRNEKEATYVFGLKDKPDQYGGDNLIFKFNGDKVALNNFRNAHFLPKNFSQQVDKYGLDIAEEALKINYTQKIDKVFTDPNRLLGEKLKIQNTLELANPEKKKQVLSALEKFKSKKRELFNLLQDKSEELKSQGIDFNAEYASGYGAKYDEIFKFGWHRDAQYLIDDIQSSQKLFPSRNFDKLKEVVEKRIEDLEQAKGVINQIKDKQSAEEFMYNSESEVYVGRLSRQAMKNDFEEKAKIDGDTYRDTEKISKQFSSYQEATRDLQKEIAELKKDQEQISNKLTEAIEYDVTDFDLKNKHGFNYSLSTVERMVKDIEGERKNAEQALLAIANLQIKLPPEEDMSVRGITVEIKSKDQASKTLNQDREKKEQELTEKEDELSRQKNSEPWLGKDKWRKKISSLETEVDVLKAEVKKLKDDYNKAVKETFYYAEIESLSSFSKSKQMFEKYSASGKVNEVFEPLKEKLTALSKQEVPADIQQFYAKLKDLETKLENNK